MHSDKEQTLQRLGAWLDTLGQFALPDWESLPELDLYMDQVILLLKRYLAPLSQKEDEKSITASIINNYVRMKVMPPPVKKKYSRSHIAYLVIICTLKQSLSISSIRRLLPEERSDEAIHALYAEFVQQYQDIAALIRQTPTCGDCLPTGSSDSLFLKRSGNLMVTSAILTALSKSLTEFLLQPDGGWGRE